MPPRKRADTTQVGEQPVDITEPAAPAGDEPLPCPGHFPGGWPDGASAVGCEDGSWSREVVG